jgi:hypothetical protein
VELLNSRIYNYRKKTNRDEVRSIVMAALSIAMELNERRSSEGCDVCPSDCEERVKNMIDSIDENLTD